MTRAEVSAVVAGVMRALRKHVDAGIKGVSDRMAAIEQRQSTTPDVAPLIAFEVQKAVAAAPTPQPDPVIAEMRAELVALRAEIAQCRASQPDSIALAKAVTVELRSVMDGDNVRAIIRDEVLPLIDKAIKGLPPPKDGEPGHNGKDADPAVVQAMVDAGITKAVALLSMPKAEPGAPGQKGDPGKDGKDVDPAVVRAMVDASVAKAVAALPPPAPARDGRDVDMAALEVIVSGQVQKAVGAIPTPKNGENGKSIELEDVRPMVEAEVAAAVSRLDAPKDGLGIASAIVERSGHLVLTFTDGTTKDVGLVVPDVADLRRWIEDEVAQIPRPKDGKDGLDGFGFDDLDVEYDEDGHAWLRFQKGERVKRFRIPGFVDAGVFRTGRTYQKGSGVTLKGSFFIAQFDNPPGRPETPDSGWRLVVKRGTDGAKGEKGDIGEQGPPGKDATQLGFDGGKW